MMMIMITIPALTIITMMIKGMMMMTIRMLNGDHDSNKNNDNGSERLNSGWFTTCLANCFQHASSCGIGATRD